MSLFYCQIIPDNKISMTYKDANNLTEKNMSTFYQIASSPIGGLEIWRPMKY